MTAARFSLILSTIGRKQDLIRFCLSLSAQSYRNFELILIDQSGGDELVEIVQRFGAEFAIIHLQSERGLSRGRNVGLNAVTGSLIGFPDDDCWYGTDLLDQVAGAFADSSSLDGLSTIVLDETEAPAKTLGQQSGALTRENVWRRSVSPSIFLRRRVTDAVGKFDEQLGVGSGSPFLSGEETDYLVRAIDQGFRCIYDSRLIVYHPDKKYLTVGVDRAYGYGAGMGFVLAKHNYGKMLVFRYLLRPLFGTIFYLATGRLYKARYQYHTLRGRWWGYQEGRESSAIVGVSAVASMR